MTHSRRRLISAARRKPGLAAGVIVIAALGLIFILPVILGKILSILVPLALVVLLWRTIVGGRSSRRRH